MYVLHLTFHIIWMKINLYTKFVEVNEIYNFVVDHFLGLRSFKYLKMSYKLLDLFGYVNF